MKPTNLRDKPCEAGSSDCIIWDGPEIECLGLCKGESVTKVVYTLGKQFCELQDVFNIDKYDITAMVADVGPVADFKTMIQNLINKAYSS